MHDRIDRCGLQKIAAERRGGAARGGAEADTLVCRPAPVHGPDRPPDGMHAAPVGDLGFIWTRQRDARADGTNAIQGFLVKRPLDPGPHSARGGDCHFDVVVSSNARAKPASGAKPLADDGLEVGKFGHAMWPCGFRRE